MKVKLISQTGTDAAALAARVCVAEGMPEKGSAKGLAAALKSGHESVIEHVSYTFSIEGISRACSHQLVRHRVASYSQQSQRYVKMDDFKYIMPESVKGWEMETWMTEAGSGESEDWDFKTVMWLLTEAYEDMIKKGVPAEDARYILPNATCTNLIMTMNARELRHFIQLRTCSRAQWEIRELACKIRAILIETAPELFENTGPACISEGKCKEQHPCGQCVLKVRERIEKEGQA